MCSYLIRKVVVSLLLIYLKYYDYCNQFVFVLLKLITKFFNNKFINLVEVTVYIFCVQSGLIYDNKHTIQTYEHFLNYMRSFLKLLTVP